MTDAEIHVSSGDAARVLQWIDTSYGPLSGPADAGDARVYVSKIGRLIVCAGVDSGKFTSFWFNSQATPWASDADFARAVVGALGITVRCDPGDGVPSGEFLQVGPSEERRVTWTVE